MEIKIALIFNYDVFEHMHYLEVTIELTEAVAIEREFLILAECDFFFLEE